MWGSGCCFEAYEFRVCTVSGVRCEEFRDSGSGCTGCRVLGFGFEFRVSGVKGYGIRDSDLGFRVSGIGYRVKGFGFRVSSFCYHHHKSHTLNPTQHPKS